VKNEIVYYKETVECRHLIFSIQGVTIDQIPLQVWKGACRLTDSLLQ